MAEKMGSGTVVKTGDSQVAKKVHEMDVPKVVDSVGMMGISTAD